jgi:hypothetical protein
MEEENDISIQGQKKERMNRETTVMAAHIDTL